MSDGIGHLFKDRLERMAVRKALENASDAAHDSDVTPLHEALS